MLTSFYTAITGLNSNSMSINVIGNNLANINTTAFKGGKTAFAELLGGAAASSATGNPSQVGLGSTVAGISSNFSQGSIAHTGRVTDAAINGNGFFVVAINDGLGYTRAGNFGFNRTGEVLTIDGFKVLGYPAVNGVVDTSTTLQPITIQKGSALPPQATAEVGITANLDSQAATNSTFSTAVQIYDSLGAPHTVTYTFTKTGATTWDWEATIPATDTGGLTTDPPASLGTGSFTFDGSGVLTAPTADETLTISGLANGASDMTVNFDVVDPNGVPRFTGYASASSVSNTTQNGRASSLLTDISFDSNGVVSGVYDNGDVVPVAQLAMANFPNVEGLMKFKGSTFVALGASGEPSIGVPGTGGRGTITGNSLEQSNVDIAQEFTNLIISQRGYQANSRIINTTDELYQDAINLKR